jgi:hypothetical protein
LSIFWELLDGGDFEKNLFSKSPHTALPVSQAQGGKATHFFYFLKKFGGFK